MADPLAPPLAPQNHVPVSLAPAAAPVVAPGAAVTAPPAAAPAAAAAPTITPDQQAMFDRNKDYLADGDHTYQTQLTPEEEAQFQQYIADKSDKQDLGRVDTHVYDMRGWWKAMKAGDPKAQLQIDPNDNLKHRNDYWKTPYHETFSAESQWAGKNAPKWNDRDQLVTPDGKVIYDDRKKKE